jgi:hypothetical protein
MSAAMLALNFNGYVFGVLIINRALIPITVQRGFVKLHTNRCQVARLHSYLLTRQEITMGLPLKMDNCRKLYSTRETTKPLAHVQFVICPVWP